MDTRLIPADGSGSDNHVNEDLPTICTAAAANREALAMNVAGRRRGDLVDRSYVPIHAQSRVDLKSSRARVPYAAGWKFPPAKGLRPLAHQSKPNSFLRAYGAAPLLVHCFAERLPATSFTPVMSLHPWLLRNKRPSPAPKSQTFRWHRTVLPDNMFGRTPENSNRPSSMFTCPNGPSRQAFAGLRHCGTGTAVLSTFVSYSTKATSQCEGGYAQQTIS